MTVANPVANPPSKSPPNRLGATGIARSAVLVIGLLAFSKAFSLLEKWAELHRFGVSAAWDTFAAANQIPEQLFNLIAGGALAYAFIPILATFFTNDDEDGAWRLASNVLNTIFLAALAASALAFVAAPWIVGNVLAPGFKNPYVDLSNPLDPNMIIIAFSPDRVQQTAQLMRVLLLGLLLFSVSGLCTGILHTKNRFLLPTLAPIMYDAGLLFGVLVLSRHLGVYGVAIGAVIGAGLHLGIQVPGLIMLRAKWRPLLNWRDPELRQVIKLMIPRALGLGLINMNLLVATSLASHLEAGSVSSFGRGYSLMQLPETLIGTAMGIVIFPTLAALSAAGDLRGKRDAMSGALRFILIASIPSAVIMVVAGRPLVGILQGGAFDEASASRVFQVLQFFALGIITYSAVEIVARAFYADKDTWTPLYVAIVTAILNLILAVVLERLLGVGGLAFANSLAVGAELTGLVLILRRRWHGINEAELITTTVKALLASCVMGAAMLVVGIVLNKLPLGSGLLSQIIRAVVEIGIGGVVYIVAALLLRVDEIRELPGLILRRRAAGAVVVEASGD